ncbi:hypothetical protein [Paraburkholderia sp. SIMBA_030]|uniref:hypothetical protein n=1 Tax=Paraburkholderia sp. SIMBA_030 TaxID=3085773 RepID=UPI00397D494E
MSSNEEPNTASTEIRAKLRDLWQLHESKRSMGGRWAMSGFALQAHAFLLRFFHGLAANGSEPSMLAELEGLSDILMPETNFFTLIQVKRSLDKRALIAALEEAYLLTELCQVHLSEALPLLRFQTAYRYRETPLIPTDITVAEILGGTASASTFSLMLTLQHDTPLVQHSDHSDRLYLLLWNQGLRNPKYLIDRAMGRLLDAFFNPTNQSLGNLARELTEFFHEAPRREAWKAPGNLLSVSDVAPEPDFQGNGVLVGQRVTFEHVRKGYVKNRPHVFDALVGQFRRWLTALRVQDEEIGDKIPVFWIDGRSGDGKSVLLLQLIQATLQESPDFPVLHLRSGNGFLDLLDTPPVGAHFPVIGLVDDVYDLTDRASWDERARESVQLGTPKVALVTCGPTEQKDLFEANLGDLFDVQSFTPAHLNADEREEFLTWFEQRTGQSRQAEQLTDQNALLVQTVFELARGERLETFARKFRRRLEALGLFEITRTIIAVNALYEHAPFELLIHEAQRVALRRLGAEDQLHFVINEDRSGTEAGVRLAHSHLAWLLFVEWREPPYPLDQQWATELAKAVQAHLCSGRETAASKLVLSLTTTPRLGDEPRDVLCSRIETISNAYSFHVDKNGGQPHPKILGTWLQILYRFPFLRLSPDPIPIAMESLTTAEAPTSSKAAVAGWLWRLADTLPGQRAEELQDAVESFFLGGSNADGVPHTLCVLSGQPLNERTTVLIERWLALGWERPDAFEMLNSWIPKAKNLDEVTSQALRWLNANPYNPKAYLVIAPLLGRTANSASTLKAAKLWLAANTDNPNVYHVLAAMVANHSNDIEVVTIAKTWLGVNFAHPHVHQVLPTLIAKKNSSADLRDMALRWLADNARHRSVQNVYAPLISRWPEDPDVATAGTAWLSRNAGHRAYPAILGSLVTHCSNDFGTIKLGEEFLRRAQGGQRSPIILALVYGGHASPQHVKRALDFIETREELPSSTGILNRVGVALAHHPKSLIQCLGAEFSAEQKHSLCYRSVCALLKYRPLIENFLYEVCGGTRGPFLVTILKTAIKHELVSATLGHYVADWLIVNFRRPGYSAILGELKRHPLVYRRTLGTLKLSNSIQQDYLNLPAKPALTG